MEAAQTNADWSFLNKKPFGFMMSMQTVLSLFIVLLVAFAPFVFEGVGFVSGCAFALFITSLIYNLFHVMGWNRKVLQLPGGINLFVPCTLWLACALDAFICLRLGVLLFRAAPNSQVLALTTVVIDGDKTTRMESAAPQFTPATSPTNPV
ncbi:hypothetical protein TELCIR_05181 [Teladorsagia circumcincta]|uniref:MARVEL domain-containing protein n=1 Tax=Teladorsagia circumcincta TaxID=45464 RepID=A0A2G9UT03_TELCI|nr:hypothetical protein TELCIR_05181 [Teladorsagia circumcincta]